MKYYCSQYKCYFCGIEEKTSKAPKGKKYRKLIETHHIKHKSDGGSNHPSNKVCCCSNCHTLIHEGHIILYDYLNIGFAKYLKWIDQNNIEQFGPCN